jgi:imidazolonepropionase-like amidohydrolase
MKRAVFALFWFGLYLAPCAAADLLIENVTVLSPERSQPLLNRYVLIRDDRIAEVLDHPPTSVAARIDGTGKFLTPGLMDSHVHVSGVPGMAMGDAGHKSLSLDYERQQPRSYLYFGVTQLLDLNNAPDAIAAFEAQPQRPDLFRCGGAPVLNGYPTVFVDPPARYRLMPDYIFEPANRDVLPVGADASAHTPEAVMARIAKSGAKCVKLFVEDGFGPASDWPILSVDSMRRVREAAHKLGLLVVAHANALDMQSIAVAAHVDVLAHGLWNWPTLIKDEGVPKSIAEHLRKVHAAKIGWQATLRVLSGQRDLFLSGTLDDPVYPKVVPPALLAWYRTDEAQFFKRDLQREFGNAPDAKIAQFQWQGVERDMRATRFLYELGHVLLLGSDTPSAPTYGSQPGYDTFREMQLLSQAGIPLSAIFAAGTINNARQFRLDKDYGTVEVGKIANLLLLTANPLDSVGAWDQIEKIILHGKPLDRASLAADYVSNGKSKSVPGVRERIAVTTGDVMAE